MRCRGPGRRLLPRGRIAWLAPLAFGLALELGRLDVVGPSVDPPPADRLDAPATWLAVRVPRLLHALLAVAPMAAGIALGRRSARAEAADRVRRRAPWALAGGLCEAAAAVAIPPTTPAIPGGIAEIRTVEVNGRAETIVLRGASRELPVLLWLSGGVGGTELGATPVAFAGLEDDVIVAVWDAAGAGLSASALPRKGLPLADAVADATAVAELLAAEFVDRPIYLAGNSGGTFIGALAVAARPELFAAYLGAGQMVDVAETDLLMYEAGLA